MQPIFYVLILYIYYKPYNVGRCNLRCKCNIIVPEFLLSLQIQLITNVPSMTSSYMLGVKLIQPG